MFNTRNKSGISAHPCIILSIYIYAVSKTRNSNCMKPFILQLLSPEQTRKHCCGNICDSRCFLKCFPVCPPVETLLRKQNQLLPEKQKCFLPNSETFDVSLCFSLMFPSVCPLWETWRNIGRKQCFRNNVSQFAQGFS